MKTMKIWILIFAIVLQWRDSKGGTALDDKIKDWELVFRGVAGSNSMINRFWRNDLDPSSCNPNYGCFRGKIDMSSTTPTMRHLKSLLVDKWICLMTEWVKIEVLSGSKRVAHFIFNGTASSKISWFDDDRLMESSYSDLEEDTCYTYSYLWDHYYKSFQIATKKDVNAYCVSKRGWLLVIDYQPTHSIITSCDWMKAAFPGVTKYPLILYAIGSKSTVWRDQNWELVFRGVAGSNSMMNRFWRNDLDPSSCNPNYGCFRGKIDMSSTTPTMRHLKSLLVDKWICLMTEWVKIEVLSGSKRVAHFIFNGTASSKTNWFDDDRLMESSYSDLEEDTCYTYSYLWDHYYKSFQIATKKDVNTYCVSKRGWLQVIDYQPTHSHMTNCDGMK